MKNKCETPCLCDTCLKARDEELNRLRKRYIKVVEGKKQTMDNLAGDFRVDWRNRILIQEKGHRKLGINQVIEEILKAFKNL